MTCEEDPSQEKCQVVPEIVPPNYSYVYTYRNKTVGGGHGGEIEYPEYNITTFKYTGNFTFEDQTGNGEECPCDLGDYQASADTGEQDINKMIADVAKSVSEQQLKADEAFFVPLLADPASYVPAPEPTVTMVGDEVDPLNNYEWKNGDEWLAGEKVSAAVEATA